MIDRVRATGMLPEGRAVVVGFSAGRDSLCLLELAVRLAGADAVLAVHVHHGLRGIAADQDARRASEAAHELGIAVRVVRVPMPDGVRRSSASPVPWARDARREALRAAADAWGGAGTPVAVAHTASDQAETVILRAISSPGVRALAGIAARDERRGVVRPLLAAGVSRAETGAWCSAHGLPWCEDATNPTSPRGQVRAVLEELQAIDTRASSSLVATAARAREDDAALQAVAARLIEVDVAAGDASIAREQLASAPVAIARRALRQLAERAVGRDCPRVESRLADVLALDPAVRGPAAADIGHGVRAVVQVGPAGPSAGDGRAGPDAPGEPEARSGRRTVLVRCVPSPRR